METASCRKMILPAALQRRSVQIISSYPTFYRILRISTFLSFRARQTSSSKWSIGDTFYHRWNNKQSLLLLHREVFRSFSTQLPTSLPSLQLWYSAVSDIPLKRILPIGLGNTIEIANINAFFGDKRMNLEIAKILRTVVSSSLLGTTSSNPDTSDTDASTVELTGPLPRLGDVTRLQGLAMSNEFLSQYIHEVLPHHMNDKITSVIERNAQIHCAGTMIEAAVDAVATSLPKLEADAAITELAKYLVQKALDFQQKRDVTDAYLKTNDSDNSTASVEMINPKGQLLQVGGSVESERLKGYPDHAPQFTATASMDDITGTVNYGRSKREAEQSAASMIWRYYSKVLAKKDTTTTAIPTTSVADEEIENPKGRIMSIGGVVSSELLPGYPNHLPRFRGKCVKSFFVNQPSSPWESDDETPVKSSYTIEATAQGRTKYEAERIASLIVWRHVMNMPMTPTSNDTNPLLPKDTAIDLNEEEDDEPFKEVEQEYLSAKERRRRRDALKHLKRQVNKYEVRDDELNFLEYTLEEQPIIYLRPGGETVIESWYRGALHPNAAFHRALCAPHVFPNYIATVNAWTRHNIIQDSDDNSTTITTENKNDENHIAAMTNDGDMTIPTYSKNDENHLSATSMSENSNDENPASYSTTSTGWTSITEGNDDEVDMTAGDDDDNDLTDRIETTAAANDHDSGEWYESLPLKPEKKTKKKSIKTYTVLAVVNPCLSHPLVKELKKDYNSSEVLAKCFIEHGRTPREARTAAGLAVNRYIIDVLLKNYDHSLESTKDDNEKIWRDMTKSERKNLFFKF